MNSNVLFRETYKGSHYEEVTRFSSTRTRSETLTLKKEGAEKADREARWLNSDGLKCFYFLYWSFRLQVRIHRTYQKHFIGLKQTTAVCFSPDGFSRLLQPANFC